MLNLVAIVAVLLLSSAWTKGCYAQDRCQYYMNYNVTSRDICAPVFSPSAYDCCRHCTEYGPACVAAVYNNMECHFKNVTAYAPSVGGVVVVPTVTTIPTSSPVPTPTTTPLPTATPPPRPITTTAPPLTSTASPWKVSPVVLQLYCTYSASCNISGDQTCTTQAFYRGQCYESSQGKGSFLYQCLSKIAVMKQFSDSHCTGKMTTFSFPLGKCIEIPGYTYQETFCLKDPPSPPSVVIQRNDCSYTCSTGCQSSLYQSGVCQDNGDGTSTRAYCYPHDNAVTYTQYSDNTACVGNGVSTWEMVGTCWTTPGFHYITNTCTKT